MGTLLVVYASVIKYAWVLAASNAMMHGAYRIIQKWKEAKK